MEINPVDIVIHLVNIVVLFIILRLLIYKPVVKFMNERTKKINDDIASAEENKALALQQKQEYDEKFANCEDEIKALMRTSTQNANKEANVIIEDAKSQSGEIIADAKQRAIEEYNRTIDGMRKHYAGLAVDIAEQILKREISSEDNRFLIDDFFAKAGAQDE